MESPTLERRRFLRTALGSGAAVIGAGALPRAAAASETGDAFAFEITRSDADWRARLSEAEYRVLRKHLTELPHSSPLAKETRAGIYCCKGCDLTIYDSTWKVPLDIGWVFFSHSEPRTVLTSIDGDPPEGMGDEEGPGAMVEVHCRRCASHLGHIVLAEGKLVHCINGTALTFIRSGA